MTVAQLIDRLKTLDPTHCVVVRAVGEGYDDVVLVDDQYIIRDGYTSQELYYRYGRLGRHREGAEWDKHRREKTYLIHSGPRKQDNFWIPPIRWMLHHLMRAMGFYKK